MKIADATVWQVAAGDTKRSYPDVFLDWDVACIGPGRKGSWPECKDQLTEDGWTKRKLSIIETFHSKMRKGDIVVLRLGQSLVYGLGKVVGDCYWSDQFGDVDGWDLQFVRRVHWFWDYRKDNAGKPHDFNKAMNFGNTVQPLSKKSPVRNWIDSLRVASEKPPRALVSLPDVEPKPLEVSEVANYLFDQGVATDSINALTEHLGELQRIASWYDRSGVSPSESETVAQLVVPLLRTLGWTPQRMAFEWPVKQADKLGRIDIVLFSRLPRDKKNLVVVVEAKKRNNAVLAAKLQAERYSARSGLKECRRLILTDGIRYGVYVKDNGGRFPDTPTAYLNINRMMDSYPILECYGAAEALELISSDWSS